MNRREWEGCGMGEMGGWEMGGDGWGWERVRNGKDGDVRDGEWEENGNGRG